MRGLEGAEGSLHRRDTESAEEAQRTRGGQAGRPVLLSLGTRVVNRRKEKYDVYIGRPSVWGNPFSHMEGTLAQFKVATRAKAIARYREWFLAQPELVARARRELRGKVLGCWCKPASCHGDVIAAIVDGEEAQCRP